MSEPQVNSERFLINLRHEAFGTSTKEIDECNVVHFTKLRPQTTPYCWVGWEIYYIGGYKLRFEILSDHDLGTDFQFVKTHHPHVFYPLQTPIPANQWTTVEIDITTDAPNDLLILIFDSFQSLLKLQLKNITITKHLPTTINLPLGLTPAKWNYVFYGFLRDANVKKYIPQESPKYLFCPKLKHENVIDSHFTIQDLQNIGQSNLIQWRLWDYSPEIFKKKYDDFNQRIGQIIPEMNMYNQSVLRTLSFFYHIKSALDLINPEEKDDEDIFVISRADIPLYGTDYDKILEHLKTSDVIVNAAGGHKSVIDQYFVFKKKALPVFQSLYDMFLEYSAHWYFGNPSIKNDLLSTRPENVIFFHLMNHGLKISYHSVIDTEFFHHCHADCIHKKK